MAVKIGSARSDERGKITGGKAGDQKSGKEVSTQNWYKHSKGWRVFRCKIPEMRPIMADLMQQACDNDNIGYDQWQRTTLSELLPAANYIIKNVKTKCETDCSRLVVDIINCALKQLGRKEVIPNANTSTLPNVLLASGLFEELKGSKYTDKEDYALAADIYNTKTKGHVVMCITSGSKAVEKPVEKPAQTALSGLHVVVTGNTVNIRTGPGTQYTALETVKKGDKLEVPDATGWTPVKYGGHVYWISDKYSDMVKG